MTLAESIRLSIVRTVTPVIAGVVALQLIRLGVDIDDATLATIIAAVLSSLYYAGARVLETRWPAAGRLLGRATPPIYAKFDGELQHHLDRVAQLIREENLRAREAAAVDHPSARFRRGTSYPDQP